MSQSDKDTILQYLVRCLVPTISFDELVGLDSTAAKKIVDTLPDISENTTVTDTERKEAIISYRKESARSLQSQSYTTSRLATSRLDRDLQVKILGTLGSKRRIESLQNFHNGKVGNLGNSGVVDFEESFLRTYQMSPEDVMTDESLREKLQSRLGNRMKNVEKFMPGNIMMWRKKGTSGQRDFVGYYVIDEVLGNENSDGDSEVRVRFIGSNTSADPNNPHAE